MQTIKYQVIEDNAGVLTLFVFQNDKVIFARSGYENTPGQLSAALSNDLNALDAGADVLDWAGEDNPQTMYDAALAGGLKVVAGLEG